MRAVIYARVSTSTQNYQRQLDDLRDYASRRTNTVKESQDPGNKGCQNRRAYCNEPK